MIMDADGMRLVEECSGVGELQWRGENFAGVAYAISRFQGFARSGMPVPGLHRVEGRLELGGVADRDRLVGENLTLRLADGRALGVTLAAPDGRVLSEGHGPSRCQCC
jgi:hypothetical protein